MHHRYPAVKVGAAAILLALLVRLAVPLAQQPEALALLVFLQTGRVARLGTETEAPAETASAPSAAQTDAPEAQAPLALGDLDFSAVSINADVDISYDAEALFYTPLTWDLTDGEPAVLILHTHATESYTQQAWEEYEESSAYRTLDADYNMVSIGDAVAQLLEAGGICVIHDRQYHDYPSYNGAYVSARETIAQYLADYPSIRMVLDIHRDAVDLEDDRQLVTAAAVDGVRSAQIMLVAGTDTNVSYPDWQGNLALAMQLTAVLEQANPGICRPINLRAQRFNLDMTGGSLLIEIGASGNTHDEALLAAQALAEGILALAHGAQ
ncbi:MAG: stage II sporulation protein P [Firmicutes bacterium]|nr:stage II sporulation protein P [Bacillota bacterium]